MKNYMFAAVLTVSVFLLAFAPSKEIVTVKGSDTMVILSQKWAESFMKKNPGIVIQVTGGGSGTGVSALINGTTDVCNSSRPMKKSEIDKIKAKYNTAGIEIPCALDGITIYVHESNPVKSLTLQQLSDIYQGKVTNWKQVGGPDAKIVLYGRENSSGTYVYFMEEVVKGDFASRTQTLPGTAAIVNAVKKDRLGIGYGGAAYSKGVKKLAVAKDATSPAVMPDEKNITDNSYPISRYLYMYTVKRPEGAVKKFIDWTLSPEGQKLVAELGYFPAKKTTK